MTPYVITFIVMVGDRLFCIQTACWRINADSSALRCS